MVFLIKKIRFTFANPILLNLITMKKIYLLLLLSASLGFAQIPTGYYSTATGTGYTLKTQLFNKIKAHTAISYSPGLWNLYYTSDVRPDGKVWDIYSDCIFVFGTFAATGGNQDTGTLGSNECERYNREHTFPKSWFGGPSGVPMYTDAFHVMSTDKHDNSLRGNMPYGIVGGTSSYTTNNGAKIGICTAANTPASLIVFEPADQYKGDVARNYFYMATCYEDKIASWQKITTDGDAVLDGTSDHVYENWYLNLMLKWHAQDPVSQKEIDRNNAVYAVQGNRNPYIDHPEYACKIWSVACAALNTNSFELIADINIYPNPSNNQRVNIETENELDDIQLININGQIMQEIKKPSAQNHTYTLENLPKGFYFLKLSADSRSITKK
ncbi:extracellular ribonuclease precursor [Flavobacterium psychrophilum]|nr:extracellular ribonuclease precursor [Flavobacterium psychrophilum]